MILLESPDVALFFPEEIEDEFEVILWWGDRCCELDLWAANEVTYTNLLALGAEGGVSPPR